MAFPHPNRPFGSERDGRAPDDPSQDASSAPSEAADATREAATGEQKASGVRDDGTHSDKERWRLAWHYADMTDGELESLASEPASLTEVARRALQSELRERGLSAEFVDPATAAAAAQPARLSKLATLRRFRDMPEALLAKSVLESAGIECLLADANIIRTDWLWSNLVGGVKLRVQEEDVAEATRLLDEDLVSQPSPELLEGEHVEEFSQPYCPRCQSLEVTCEDFRQPETLGAPRLKLAGTASSRSASPLPADWTWTCQACGNQWCELEPTA